jgi:hypothetical protein
MKTSTFKTVIVMLATLLFVAQLFGQDLVGMRIDVQGSRHSDQMWLFENAACTRAFDNGWDAIDNDLHNENIASPEILGMESTANFQIDAVSDLNNTYIGFKAGEDTLYTLTFTSQNIETVHSQLYLIDSIANQTIDITASGVVYRFTAHSSNCLVKRFKIVTTLPVPVETPVVDTTAIDTTVVDTVVVNPGDGDSQYIKGLPNQLDSHDLKVRVFTVNRTVYVNNTDKGTGELNLYNAETGKVVKNFRYAAQTTTAIPFDGPAGVYIMNGRTEKGQISGKLLIQ